MSARVLNFPARPSGHAALSLEIGRYLVAEMGPVPAGRTAANSEPDGCFRDDIARLWGHLTIADIVGIIRHCDTIDITGNDDDLAYAQFWIGHAFAAFVKSGPAKVVGDALARIEWLGWFLESYDPEEVRDEVLRSIRIDAQQFALQPADWINPDPAATLGGWWALHRDRLTAEAAE